MKEWCALELLSYGLLLLPIIVPINSNQPVRFRQTEAVKIPLFNCSYHYCCEWMHS